MIISKEEYDKRVKAAVNEAIAEDRAKAQRFEEIVRRITFLERTVQRIESRLLDTEKIQLEAMMKEAINKNQKGEENHD